jgi:hypothetical protein
MSLAQAAMGLEMGLAWSTEDPWIVMFPLENDIQYPPCLNGVLFEHLMDCLDQHPARDNLPSALCMGTGAASTTTVYQLP